MASRIINNIGINGVIEELVEMYWEKMRERTWNKGICLKCFKFWECNKKFVEREVCEEAVLVEDVEMINGICGYCSKDGSDVVGIEIWWKFRTFVCRRCRNKW